MFSDKVCKNIGNYVYRLIDPRNGETFYVGKGKGNRVFAHIQEAVKISGDVSKKLARIRAIQRAGLKVTHVIHRHEIPDEAVDHVEAAIIDAYPGLTNIQGGYGSDSFGPMHAEEIKQKYELPELEFNPPHKLILLNINMTAEETGQTDLYDQTRYAWRISKERAQQTDYVLSVVRGIVKQAFVAEEWLPVNEANFPNFTINQQDKDRFGFVGHVAPKHIIERYVGKYGKRISNPEMKHVQNPVAYWPR